MFVLFTDFGADDIYVWQVKAALLRHAPGAIIIDLLHRASMFDPKAGAYLLAALHSYFPKGAVFLAIVDPGVGGLREAIAIEADDIGTSAWITDCCPLSPHAQDDRVKNMSYRVLRCRAGRAARDYRVRADERTRAIHAGYTYA